MVGVFIRAAAATGLLGMAGVIIRATVTTALREVEMELIGGGGAVVAKKQFVKSELRSPKVASNSGCLRVPLVGLELRLGPPPSVPRRPPPERVILKSRSTCASVSTAACGSRVRCLRVPVTTG